MYTRPYTDDAKKILIPESYGGTALTGIPEREDARGEDAHIGEHTEKSHTDDASQVFCESKAADAGPSFLQRLGFGNLFGDIFRGGKFGLHKIGTEEILILATAAFLFFSKDGDRECAIMLLLLLFIS